MNFPDLWTTLASALLLAACGGGNGTPNDAGPMDGSTLDAMSMGDGGSAFDPSITYPGEGEACEFSIRCGDLQLCVDDACIRHERLDPTNVHITDYRVLFGDAANPSPLFTESDTDWFDPQARYYSYLFPGHDGPALVFSMHSETRVDVAVYDDHFRSVHVDGIWMTALGYSPEGLVVVGGADNVTGRPRIVMFDHDNQLLFDQLTAPSLDDEVRASPVAETTAMLGVPQSFLWKDDHFEVAFALGDENANYDPRFDSSEEFLTPRPPTHTILGEMTVSGNILIKPLGADLLVPGARAWLVQDERGVGVILHYGLKLDEFLAEITTEWRNISSGETAPISTDVGSAAEYFQPSLHTWYYLYQAISMTDPSVRGPFCQIQGFRNGQGINIAMDPFYCNGSIGTFEGIALPSSKSMYSRVVGESDPILMSYAPGGGGGPPPLPFTMHLDRYSSNGAVDTMVVPFESPGGCYQPGDSGFPVSRFGIGLEVITTGTNSCSDPLIPHVGLVEGHLVTGD